MKMRVTRGFIFFFLLLIYSSLFSPWLFLGEEEAVFFSFSRASRRRDIRVEICPKTIKVEITLIFALFFYSFYYEALLFYLTLGDLHIPIIKSERREATAFV